MLGNNNQNTLWLNVRMFCFSLSLSLRLCFSLCVYYAVRPFKWSYSPLIRSSQHLYVLFAVCIASFIHPLEGLYFLFDLQWRMYSNILFHWMVWTYIHSSHWGKIIDIYNLVLTRVHFLASILLLGTTFEVNFLSSEWIALFLLLLLVLVIQIAFILSPFFI